MALLRPRWTGVSVFDASVAIAGSGGTVNLIDLSDGPGIIKGGGIRVSSLAFPDTDYDLKLVVDGVTLFDFDLNDLDILSADSATRPWDFVEAMPVINFDFKENANLAYLTSVLLELENNNAGADTILVSSGIDYHIGA